MDTTELGGEKGAIITARGTGDGLVIRIDGRAETESLKAALNDFITSRKKFLSGNEVTLEWIGAKPDNDVIEEHFSGFFEAAGIKVKASRLKEPTRILPVSDTPSDVREYKSLSPSLSLFDGMGGLGFNDDAVEVPQEKGNLSADSALWDDPDARVIYTTLRSGQRVESEHSLIVFGDINSGAEIIAGGDVVVLGALRGVAHAGAYDETGGGRVIFALSLQPTQLRIGTVITRGGVGETNRGPEIARVDGDTITVEPYQARGAFQKQLRANQR